jgi:hypothetical protein
LGGPWSTLAKKKKPAQKVVVEKIVVVSVDSWEELDNNNTFLALPQHQPPETEDNEDNEQDVWDNNTPPSPPSSFTRPPSTPSSPLTTTTTSITPTNLIPTLQYEFELAQHQSLSASRPILLINAKVARAGGSAKSLSQSATNTIQGQLQQALSNDFENRADQLFQSGVCFHTDTSNGGARLEADRSVLEEIHLGETFVAVEYPSEYVGGVNNEANEEKGDSSSADGETERKREREGEGEGERERDSSVSKAVLWENITRPSSSRAITMIIACVRECHHTMEWKSAMRSEIDRLGKKQQDLLEARMVKEMELIRKCDEASDNLHHATAAVIQFHDGFATTMAESTEQTAVESNKSLEEARDKVASCKLTSMESNLEFERFEKRERRRSRRAHRRVQEEQTRKERYGSSSTSSTSSSSNGSDEAPQNKQKMSLLDQIIAIVFDGIPLGQRIPVEVGGSTNPHHVLRQSDGNQKLMLETHFRCLLAAQLRIRHQWTVDFGYVPLHEFDNGVESGTDSDSDGDEVEEAFQRDEIERVMVAQEDGDSDSGSDGWRRRGGGELHWSDNDDNDEDSYQGERKLGDGVEAESRGRLLIGIPNFLRR